MESSIPSGISYSDTSTDDPISYTPYGPDSCFNPDPRSPRHIINRGTTCFGKEEHSAVRFTPQKSACYSNHRSTHTNQTESRRRQPPGQMGMAFHVNRRRGADSLPESLTARKAKPQVFHALPRGKPCGSRYNFSPSTAAAMDLPLSSPSGHSVSRGHHRVSYGNPTNQRSPTTHLLRPPVDTALQQTGSRASTLQQELCYMLTARRGATLATRSSPDPTSAKAGSAGAKTPLIVDSGATVSIIKLLASIREIPPTSVGRIGNQGLIAYHMGDLGPFGPALFIPAAVRNLVSLDVITKHLHVSFKSGTPNGSAAKKPGCYKVKISPGKFIEFVQDERD